MVVSELTGIHEPPPRAVESWQANWSLEFKNNEKSCPLGTVTLPVCALPDHCVGPVPLCVIVPGTIRFPGSVTLPLPSSVIPDGPSVDAVPAAVYIGTSYRGDAVIVPAPLFAGTQSFPWGV
jgi:hypothetical protein